MKIREIAGNVWALVRSDPLAAAVLSGLSALAALIAVALFR